MEFFLYFIFEVLVYLFIYIINSISFTKSNIIEFENKSIRLENPTLTFCEKEAKFIANKLLNLQCAKKPLKITCPECINPKDGNTFLHYYSLNRHRKFHYKFLVQFNDKKEKIYIHFNSPIFNKRNYIYFKKYFLNKIPVTNFDNFRINLEILHLYEKYFKSKLYANLDRLVKSKRGKFTLVFGGNSLGGSLATFAAYDVSKNYKKISFKKNIEVYSFNSLVISDDKFANAINSSTVVVHRIYKEDDFLIHPNCIFNKSKSEWICKNKKINFVNTKRKKIINKNKNTSSGNGNKKSDAKISNEKVKKAKKE